MEKINCKSCGGTLQKVGPADYKCAFCGTIHHLEMDDSESVRVLLEQNNQRWLFINRSMDLYFEKINNIIAYKSRLKNPRLAMIIVSGICMLALANLGVHFYGVLDRESRGIIMKDMNPFLAVAGIMLALDGYYAAMILYGRHRLKKMVKEAQGIVLDVLRTYQQMSEKPAKELILSLHNPKKLMDKDSVQLAMDIYAQALMEPAGKGNGPGPGL